MNGSGLGSPERSRGWLESRYLFPWLTVATKGLSIGSKNRVREEI